MNDISLENYILNNMNKDPLVMDYLKFELQKKLYYYGEQFKNPSEINNSLSKKNYFSHVKNYVKEYFGRNNFIDIKENSVVSEAYFSFSDGLKNLGFNVYKTPWAWHSIKENSTNHIYTKSFINNVKLIEKNLFDNDFNYLISEEFIDKIQVLINDFTNLYSHKNVKGLFLAQDMSFFQKIIIKAFKNNNKKSFIFLHGLPARYNNIDDNRADYLLVWGEKIKNNYIKSGVNKDKIFVVGHPFYEILKNKDLRFSNENILVVTKAQAGAPIDSNDQLLFQDRSRSILYLYSIQNILIKFGVKKVRFRVHPSENINWYLKFLDKSFYIPDFNTLKDSLESSTLVIGPMSTLLLESLFYGVNYLLYEPQKNNISIYKENITSPFDDSDKNIPVAKNEEELYEILKERVSIHPDCFYDYIKTPFDIKFIKDLV